MLAALGEYDVLTRCSGVCAVAPAPEVGVAELGREAIAEVGVAVAAELGRVRITGRSTLPPGVTGDSEEFLRSICRNMLRVFCERTCMLLVMLSGTSKRGSPFSDGRILVTVAPSSLCCDICPAELSDPRRALFRALLSHPSLARSIRSRELSCSMEAAELAASLVPGACRLFQSARGAKSRVSSENYSC